MEGDDTGSLDMKAGMVSPTWLYFFIFFQPSSSQIFVFCLRIVVKPVFYMSSYRPHSCRSSLSLVSSVLVETPCHIQLPPLCV